MTARKLVSEAMNGAFLLKITPIVIAECVFVLMGKQFNLKKQDTSTLLISFINLKGIEMEEKEVIERALIQFVKKGIDFADAYIAEHARAVTPHHVASVNVKDFVKLGITVSTPDDLLNS